MHRGVLEPMHRGVLEPMHAGSRTSRAQCDRGDAGISSGP